MDKSTLILIVLLFLHLTCTNQNIPTDADALRHCPQYMHKFDVQTGTLKDIPEGFFLFDRDTVPGLFKSPISEFKSSLIPDTRKVFPRSISISDDGQWIFFIDAKNNVPYVIRNNGCYKTVVPTVGVPVGSSCPGGFYRDSPLGNEIYYLAGDRRMHAIAVTFTEEGPDFGNDRMIAQLSSLRFNLEYAIQYAVSGDQIFGEIGIVGDDSAIISRTGFLTIPDDGSGTATDTDIYHWADDDYRLVEGCGHTMSFDGQYVAANAGPQFYSSSCIPTGHKGFYVAPFRRVDDPPLDQYMEHLLKFGVSLNWCPEQFQSSDYDFWGWYFTNNNAYIAGRMISLKDKSCAWIVDWQKSIWTMLCPLDSNIRIRQPAVHFGEADTGNLYVDPTCQGPDTGEDTTVDSEDPGYAVISPNGGELFHIGDRCTVKVTSAYSGDAVLHLCLEDGLYYVPLSISRSFNPQIDSIFVIEIPDTFDIYGTKVSAVSDECVIKLSDYIDRILYYDESDDFFRIVP
jgi:hypothetical protein